MDYKVLKILTGSTPLLITPNGKERKTNTNDVKPYSMIKLTENAWVSYLSSIQTMCKNCNYNLRPEPNSKKLKYEQFSYLSFVSIFSNL